MTADHLRAAVLLGAATLTALAAAACTTSGTAAGSTETVHWQTVTDGPTTSASVVEQKRMFPNTNFTAALNSWEGATQMVDFQVEKWIPGGANDGHYETDPSRPEIYRLPLAPNVRILSVSSLCSPQATPNLNGVPCTAQQLITGLQGGHMGIADIHVNANDQIDSVKEDYVP